eukprot:2771696-Pyramimonas_sp.AAC.1
MGHLAARQRWVSRSERARRKPRSPRKVLLELMTKLLWASCRSRHPPGPPVLSGMLKGCPSQSANI